MQRSKPLLIIADDLENEAVSTIVLNKLRGAFNVVATKAPGFGDNQTNSLNDIATLTGATFFQKDLNMELKDLTFDDLGTAKKVVVEKDSTTIINGGGNSEAIQARVNEINAAIENANSDYDKKQQRERLAKLTNGVALIKVGATTESELKEKKLRLEDALNATRAAVAEGIVMGGGAALMDVYNEVKENCHSDIVDVQKGINVVLDALSAPLYQIAENSGFDGSEIVEAQQSQAKDFGFDAKNGVWVNMFEAGIVDPTKVTRSAILNASSIAGLFITTEAAVGIIKEKEEPAMPAGGMY